MTVDNKNNNVPNGEGETSPVDRSVLGSPDDNPYTTIGEAQKNDDENSGEGEESKRFSPFETFVLTCAVLFLFYFISPFIAIATYEYFGLTLDQLDTPEATGYSLEIISPIIFTICFFATIGLIKLKGTLTVGEYLRIKKPTGKEVFMWTAVTLAVLFLEGLIAELAQRPVNQFTLDAYDSSISLVLLLIVLCVFAPLFEETLFRGFMLSGMAPKEGCPASILVLSAGLWAAIHAQYDYFDGAIVFVSGLVLGSAYIRTKNLVIPIYMHALMNLISYIQLLLFAEYFRF